MNQHNDRRKPARQKSLIIKSLSWIGIVSIFSNNQVFAQTQSASDNLVPLPTVEITPQPSSDRLQRLQRRLVKPKAKVVRQQAAPQPRVATYVAPSRKIAVQKTQDYNGAFIDPTNLVRALPALTKPLVKLFFPNVPAVNLSLRP